MAVSGSVSTDKYSSRYYTLSWTATQNVSTNKSTVNWTLKAVGGSGWYAERDLSVKITSDNTLSGTTSYSKTSRVERYAGTVKSGTFTITHDSSGNAKFKVAIKAAVYVSTVNCTGSNTFTLNTIPRASSITSVSNCTIRDGSCDVKWTPLTTSFSYKVSFYLGSTLLHSSSAISPGSTSAQTYSYKPTIDVANKITTSTTDTMTVYLYTYSSSACTTQIGSTASKTCTLTVPSDVVPSIGNASVTIDNSANSIIKGWGLYVAGYSKAKIAATASGSYGSTISSFTISDGYSTTVSGTSLSYTGEILTSTGSKTFNVIATDSRGRKSTSKSAGTITVYEYSKPKIAVFNVDRSTDNAKKIIVSASCTYSSVNGKNSTKLKLYYKKTTSESWIEYTSGSINNNSSTTLAIDFDEYSSYDFQLTANDALFSAEPAEYYVSTIQVLMDFKAGGKGLGIGKIAEFDALEVDMESRFTRNILVGDSNEIDLINPDEDTRNILIGNSSEIRSINSDGTTRSILKGISSEGNTILGYGNYTNADADTNIYGDKIHLKTNNGIYTDSRIILPNDVSIRGLRKDGEENSMLYTSTSNNTVLGYGGYLNSNGNTNIYGNDIYIPLCIAP